MHRVMFMCLDAGIAAILLLPVFFLLNKYLFRSKTRSLCYYAFAIYLSAMYAVVGLPDVLYVQLDLNINLKPFAYMFSDYETSLLNVLLFMPLGFLLPTLWSDLRKPWKTAVYGFCTSLLIEVLQIFTFRATDVNDLITNTLGTILGWCIARPIRSRIPQKIISENIQDVSRIYIASFSVMFFIQPFFANFILNIL